MKPLLSVVPIASLLSVGACTSLSSTPLSDATDRGLVYQLPRNDAVVTVVTERHAEEDMVFVKSISIAAGPAHADRDAGEYVLRFNRSLIGDSNIDIGVTPDGLLTKSNASATPKLVEALTTVAETATKVTAQVAALPASAPVRTGKINTCNLPGSHQFRVPISAATAAERAPATPICGGVLEATVSKLGSSSKVASVAADGWADGVYYRQSEPFVVTVKPEKGGSFGFESAALVLSSSLANRRFLPFKGTLFGRNDARVGFVDGQPQSFVQTTDGELPALLKLPASLLQAYFAAVGALFNGFSARDKAEAGAIANDIQLELVKQKLTICMAAIQKNPSDAEYLKTLGCVAP